MKTFFAVFTEFAQLVNIQRVNQSGVFLLNRLFISKHILTLKIKNMFSSIT